MLLCFAALVIGASAINFEVPAGRQECFYEDIMKGTDVGLTYQVTRGGALDIDAVVTAPDGAVIYAGRKETEGRYFFRNSCQRSLHYLLFQRNVHCYS